MLFVGYEPGTKGYHFWSRTRRMVVISSTATYNEFDFPNCSREKLSDKPPPNNQSTETNNQEDTNQGGDNGLQPPDQT